MKQFIIHLNDQKITDKKFILEDLDGTHLLIRGEARDEISRKVDEWMDMVSRRAGGRARVCVGGYFLYSNFIIRVVRLFGLCRGGSISNRRSLFNRYLYDSNPSASTSISL